MVSQLMEVSRDLLLTNQPVHRTLETESRIPLALMLLRFLKRLRTTPRGFRKKRIPLARQLLRSIEWLKTNPREFRVKSSRQFPPDCSWRAAGQMTPRMEHQTVPPSQYWKEVWRK